MYPTPEPNIPTEHNRKVIETTILYVNLQQHNVGSPIRVKHHNMCTASMVMNACEIIYETETHYNHVKPNCSKIQSSTLYKLHKHSSSNTHYLYKITHYILGHYTFQPAKKAQIQNKICEI